MTGSDNKDNKVDNSQVDKDNAIRNRIRKSSDE